MYADLSPDDGGAEVRIDYELQTDGIAPLRFELLGFGDSKAEGFWFGDRDTGVPMRLEACSQRAIGSPMPWSDQGIGSP
jgi:hypothetical protein